MVSDSLVFSLGLVSDSLVLGLRLVMDMLVFRPGLVSVSAKLKKNVSLVEGFVISCRDQYIQLKYIQ